MARGVKPCLVERNHSVGHAEADDRIFDFGFTRDLEVAQCERNKNSSQPRNCFTRCRRHLAPQLRSEREPVWLRLTQEEFTTAQTGCFPWNCEGSSADALIGKHEGQVRATACSVSG